MINSASLCNFGNGGMSTGGLLGFRFLCQHWICLRNLGKGILGEMLLYDWDN